MKIRYLLALMLSLSMLYADFSHLHKEEIKDAVKVYQWKKEEVSPFNELLLSWDALRPKTGSYLFQVRIQVDGVWSPWLNYGEWSSSTQFSFSESFPETFAKVFQDTAETSDGKLATGFEVRAEAKEGASLQSLTNLYVCTSDLSRFTQNMPTALTNVQVPGIAGQSQMILNHPRGKDMCSPTSTSTVINFLLGPGTIDPLLFASRIKDERFDIYGNWAFNVAEANHLLHGKYSCHIERLNSFEALLSYLQKEIPVVVSVKGSLPGAVKPYNGGHLMVITGFDAKNQKVLCIDSAYSSNEETIVAYPLEDFLKVWGTRKNLAYVFEVRTQK